MLMKLHIFYLSLLFAHKHRGLCSEDNTAVEMSLSNGMDPSLPLAPLSLKDFRSAGEGDVLMHLSSCRPLGTGVCRKGKPGVKQQNLTDKPNTSIICSLASIFLHSLSHALLHAVQHRSCVLMRVRISARSQGHSTGKPR